LQTLAASSNAQHRVEHYPMDHPQGIVLFRVRYSETDAMRTYYNSRALEWFECGRTELLRSLGRTYREMEQEGVFMPLREAHVEFLGPAYYDDLLRMTSTLWMPGKARFRFDVEIVEAQTGRPVCRGWTEHVSTGASGKPIRPPKWLIELVQSGRQAEPG
jgi:acyl-CoA thioester hydrolase